MVKRKRLISWKGGGEFDTALHAAIVRVETDDNDNVIFYNGDSDEMVESTHENAMAKIIQSEGAWGDGDRFNLRATGRYVWQIVQCLVIQLGQEM